MVNFSKRLKQLRIEYDYTLQELAEELETTEATLSRYENDKSYPNTMMLLRLSELFNCSLDYLLGESNEKRKVEELFNKYYEEGAELEDILNKFRVEYKGKKLSNQEIANLIKIQEMMRNTNN
ncbi:helix-turn-helix transcriptional regulator [Halanaerobiaceae bacterium Z-7014]|uniref:Helix-turn-helix transcriptional regulator n=1 Tax=Halonatronomonas betaini TaxID=2778430 RepID=A0A931AMK7_9FIRM|nr:helix-turn-helix domain-containing protein [Halonatronomonas betaini]MBF8435487.1 helix-turn-helix transcriptional regulator [Halonatronomonas betaini]